MLILLLVISILMIVLGFVIMEISYNENIGATIVSAGIVAFITILIALTCVNNAYISNRNIDAKIAMYTEENKKIEEKVEITVKQYMDFEKDTYKDLKVDSYINLVSLYPDLKSDKLIKEQIKTYQKNSEEIKSLKLEKLNQQAYKWWLYFGR